MATNNFMSVNKTGIYTIDTGDDDIDAEYLLQSTQEAIYTDLAEAKLGDTLQDIAAYSSDNDNNFGGWTFALISGKGYNYVTVEVLYRNGYYSGANFDYIISYMVEGEEYDDEGLDDAAVWGKDDYKTISATEVKRLRSNARAIEKGVAKILAKNTTALNKVGQFSNGEAVYEEAK